MDGWLKVPPRLILPACYLCYACSGDLSKATKEQRDLVLDAAWEACEMLKAAHIPVDDKENTDCYRAGTPGRRKMDAMVLALCKTPLGRLCVSDHAMHAVAEMQYLDEAFEGLRTRTSVRMTAWDTLRSQMPRGTSCGKRRREQGDKCMEKEADASLPLFVWEKPLSLLRRQLPSIGATATTAASGGNREELLGPRPAGCERQRSRRWEPQPGQWHGVSRDGEVQPFQKSSSFFFSSFVSLRYSRCLQCFGKSRAYSLWAKRSSRSSTTPLSSCVRMTRPAAAGLVHPGQR